MRLSIILPTAGNDPQRNRNFNECLKCINSQTFRDFEVIVVEQSLDGKVYKENNPIIQYKHIAIKDPEDRGFNLSWCRNVGARQAKGDILVLMDSDFVFENQYFQIISQFNGKFAAGSENYYWCNHEHPTHQWINTRNFDNFRMRAGGPRDEIFKFRSMSMGCGYGAILVYDSKWYWEVFGGYNENFFRYGWEDKSATETIKVLLGKTDEDMDRIKYDTAHLSHRTKDIRNISANEKIFNIFKSLDQRELAERIKKAGVGKIDSPTLISDSQIENNRTEIINTTASVETQIRSTPERTPRRSILNRCLRNSIITNVSRAVQTITESDIFKNHNKLRVLLLCDIKDWAFDHIAKSFIKHNPYTDKIEYEIKYRRDIANITEVNIDMYDYIYVFFEAEQLIPPSKKVIRGCYSAFWLENPRFTESVIAAKFSLCAGSVYVNKFLHDSVASRISPAHPTIIIHDSSDESLFYPIEDKKKNNLTVIFVGNTKRKVKNFDVIEWICREAGVELMVCENVKNTELVNFYNQADLAINFSEFEGGPQTFIESALCGVPMIVRNNNELGKLIPCFRGETKEEFVNIIRSLKNDREKCKSVGEEARKAALKDFTYSEASRRFGEFILRLKESR
jgi:glycosyltransferase involved in cell wall biosynthesis